MKKKLTLDVESLDVESFVPAVSAEVLGTVHGYITLRCTDTCSANDPSCDACNSMACGNSVDAPCAPTFYGITCEYETCGACNPTDPNCTTYCP